jgi:hypothetical protein
MVTDLRKGQAFSSIKSSGCPKLPQKGMQTVQV